MLPMAVMTNVTKSFGAEPVLKDLSLAIHAGEIVVLLGHNGAGKTVTVRLLSTLAWPSKGSVTVDGHDTKRDAVAIRRRIGVCLDQPLLWPDLTGYQTLRLLAEAYGVPWNEAEQRTAALFERFRFALPADKLVSEYSLGMKRKLGLTASLLHHPALVIWDEPEIGLDAPSRIALKEIARELRDRGTAVLVTTHAIELAEAVADRIAVVRQGSVAACDTPAALRQLRGADASLEQAFLMLIEDGYIAPANPGGAA